MNNIDRVLYGIFLSLSTASSCYSAPAHSAIDALSIVKKNAAAAYFNTNIKDTISSLSAAFQVKATSLQTACIIKGGAKMCLKSDAVTSIPSAYKIADSMTLPAFVEAVVYSEPNFSGTTTILPFSSAASTPTLFGLTLGSIKLIRKACVYYNKNYAGSTTCDYQESGTAGNSSLGFNSLKLASGIWIDAFQSKGQSGLHIPYSSLSAQLINGSDYFPIRPLSYIIHSQNEPVDIVKVNSNTQKLEYGALDAGGKIMDFSTAGYMGGGVARPVVLPVVTLTPPQDPNADAGVIIQEAINQQAKQPLVNGFRNGGSIFLSAGTWNISSTININASGIVLQGDVNGGTLLVAKGEPRTLIQMGATNGDRLEAKKYTLTDAYVPLGAEQINLDDTSGLKSGDQISIQIPVTAEWIAFMGMNKLVRDGKPQVWLTPGSKISIDRVIQQVDSPTQITLDAALPQPIDATYTQSLGGAFISKYATNNRITQVALEHIQAKGAFLNVPISSPLWNFVSMNNLVDSWMEDVALTDFGGTAISCNKRCQRVTLNNLSIARTQLQPNTSGSAGDINLSGSQVLIRNASMSGPQLASSSSLNYFFVMSGSVVEGPNVILNMTQASGNRGSIQPHMRWSAGLLVDNAVLPNGRVEFMNRGIYGTGHGWTIGYGVIWNSITNSFHNQTPPGSNNWAVGVLGKPSPKYFNGNWGTSLHLGRLYNDIPSLYLYQLNDRLGIDALRW